MPFLQATASGTAWCFFFGGDSSSMSLTHANCISIANIYFWFIRTLMNCKSCQLLQDWIGPSSAARWRATWASSPDCSDTTTEWVPGYRTWWNGWHITQFSFWANFFDIILQYVRRSWQFHLFVLFWMFYLKVLAAMDAKVHLHLPTNGHRVYAAILNCAACWHHMRRGSQCCGGTQQALSSEVSGDCLAGQQRHF